MAKSSTDTSGIPDPQEAARLFRDKTGMRPNDSNVSAPRVYEELVPTKESTQAYFDHNGIKMPGEAR